jgi:DNA-binding transcriptional regulator YiaG
MAKCPRPIMGKTEYRTILDQLGLNPSSSARFLGVNPRTSRRWASGESPIDTRTAMLLRVMRKYKISPRKALTVLDE